MTALIRSPIGHIATKSEKEMHNHDTLDTNIIAASNYNMFIIDVYNIIIHVNYNWLPKPI